MSGRPGMAHERLHAAWYAARQPALPSLLVLWQHPPTPDASIEKPVSTAACGGVLVDVRLKPPRLLRCSTDVRPAGHGPRAPPGRVVRSTTAHAAIWARALAASTQPRRVHREAVSSSLERRARRRAAEATTLAAVLHRCQAGRAWPMSASRPHGTQHDSPRCRLCSCSRGIEPSPDAASRSREQQLAEACSSTCG